MNENEGKNASKLKSGIQHLDTIFDTTMKPHGPLSPGVASKCGGKGQKSVFDLDTDLCTL